MLNRNLLSQTLETEIINWQNWHCAKKLLLAGDVEANPGPGISMITQNCRGLKKDSKLKQLLNRIYKDHVDLNNIIIALQETHLEKTYLKYQWRGTHIFTPSSGQRGGCITLLGENMELIRQIDIDNEAHVAKVNMIDNSQTVKLIIVNLHAPCSHNRDKVEFFREIRTSIDVIQATEVEPCRIILLGDFNLAYTENDRINTKLTNMEVKIGQDIKDIFADLQLVDCWDNNERDMTWRHGNKMSKIDRVWWSPELIPGKINVQTDWTYTDSDHAAVIVKFIPRAKKSDKITRIDTRFMQSTELKHKFLQEIKIRVDQIVDTTMNPHQKLEFLKMSIRSVALEIASNEKKASECKLKSLKEDISFWQKAFENDKTGSFHSTAISNLNDLTAQRDKMLNDRGEFLSQRVKTKWYQEGERSSKYFLNLQRAKTRKSEMNELMVNGISIIDDLEIRKNVETFYKNLYEKGDSKINNEKDLDTFLRNIERVAPEKIEAFDKHITIEDLLKTLSSCTDSAPGPDGIPYSLIKLTWNYYGKLLIESWEYALLTGELTHSHQSSYLRLIPKEGKSPNVIKNWRPITLSNCDFKIITKTLARKLTETVSDNISFMQTAYIPGRQITDNLHILLHAVEKAATANLDSMVVSLDAEKAFDSVEHWYLRGILKKLGLNKFINIFNLMYKNQSVDILLNNGTAGSYKIKNGVKQGDALSCILFIMSMEPLIKNIITDNSIDPINDLIPKITAYADDITCLIKPNSTSLTRIFNHYNELTNLSGLKLNADKTEVISNCSNTTFLIDYQGSQYPITPIPRMKVNGIILSYNEEEVMALNFDKMYNAVLTQLRQWSNRGLSLLGKIQIFKTFGLSQIIYMGSVLMLSKKYETKLDEVIYRFIWNRDMTGNKAPDRIKRNTLKRNICDL